MIANIEGIVKSVTKKTNQKGNQETIIKLLQEGNYSGIDYAMFTEVKTKGTQEFEKGQEIEMNIIQERFDIGGRTFIVNKEV